MATTHSAPQSSSSSHSSSFVALDDLLRRHGRLTLSATLYVSLKVAEEVQALLAQGRHAGSIPASRVRMHGKASIELAKGRYPSNAPELKQGEAGDTLSDVYEVGSLLYRMLTGVRPKGDFAAPSAVNPAVDTSLDDLVMSAVSKDPAERPYSIDALIKGLRGIFQELDLEPSPSELNVYVGDATVAYAPPPQVAAPKTELALPQKPAAAAAPKKIELKHRAPPKSWGDDDEDEDSVEVSVVRHVPSSSNDKLWGVGIAVFAVVMLFIAI
jgi:serine/threonine protein kinase